MDVDWIRDRNPQQPEKYAVVVELPDFKMRYLSTRSWSGTGWLNMGTNERVTCWLDRLEMP